MTRTFLSCVLICGLLLIAGCAPAAAPASSSSSPASVETTSVSSSSPIASAEPAPSAAVSVSDDSPSDAAAGGASPAPSDELAAAGAPSVPPSQATPTATLQKSSMTPPVSSNPYTTSSRISDVINDPVFGNYGRLIFPTDSRYYSGSTLGNLKLTWYNNIDPNETVEIVNYLHNHADAGDPVFFDIYTNEEKLADPAKQNTGLFFFRGKPGEKFAICNAGGGFAYVGAMQDSFPHALELSKLGYNAFALIYRPGAQTACEDLARAISFVFDHADELGIDTDSYSLWGGSAGGRMAAYLGTYGTAFFGEEPLPRPGAVITQYTGHSEYSEVDPPTYANVGTSDYIANWRTMQARLDAMSAAGIPTEFRVYEGLPHGFGIGSGTVADGWLNDAVRFWEEEGVHS